MKQIYLQILFYDEARTKSFYESGKWSAALIDKELVYRSPDGYSVYDRFLEIWLREE